MAKKLKDCKTIPPDYSDGVVSQDFTIIIDSLIKRGVLWSFNLQAPISRVMTIEEIRISIDGDMNFGLLTEWHLQKNVLAIIKGNKAGLNGEELGWEEILELYS